MTERAMLEGALNVAKERQWSDLEYQLNQKLAALHSEEAYGKLYEELTAYLMGTTGSLQQDRAREIPAIFERNGWIAPDRVYASWDDVPEDVVVADRDKEHWVKTNNKRFLRETLDDDWVEAKGISPDKYIPFKHLEDLDPTIRKQLHEW